MNKLKIITIVSITALLLLSGCVGNDTAKTTPVPTKTPVIIQPTSSETPTTVIKYNASNDVSANSGHAIESTNSTNSTALTATGSDWCKPGSNKSVAGTIFTITGLTTDDKGNSVCKAEATILNGNATYIFSKDGKIGKMTSTASNGSSSASSSASSSINTT